MALPKLLISEEKIAEKVDSLARKLASELEGSSTILVGLLTGSVVFLSDLMRRLSHYGLLLEVDFMIISSYNDSGESSGSIDIVQDVRIDMTGRTALLVDDIVDTGRTLNEARRRLYDKGAAKVITCALLDKPARRKIDIKPDYVGFIIENKFVVGYGLDAGNRYRQLPYIATLEE